MRKIIILTLISILPLDSLAGFCDSTWGKQKITNILVHGNVAYIKIDPGLNNANDAASASVKNEVALLLYEENQKNIYPLLLTAFAAQKEVTMMYCNGTMVHGYKGGDNTVVKLKSLSIAI